MQWSRVVGDIKRGKSSFVNAAARAVGRVNAGKSTFVNALTVLRRVVPKGFPGARQRRKR
jgi:tRNA U34 5-carboxymethylaminomethyl modifying GTPase MnmE/TrmE